MNKGGNITIKKHAIRHVATIAVTVATWPFSNGEMIYTLISLNKLTWLVIFYYFFTKRKENKTKKIIKYYQPRQLVVGLL